MGYAFAPTATSVKKELRRIARERLDHALRKLDRGHDPNEAVHEARKDIKKLRALIRLVRPAFPDYKPENAALRDTARLLSGIRDATAMVEACDRLIASYGKDDTGAALFALREHLLDARPEADGTVAERIAKMQVELADAKVRVSGWDLNAKGFDALQGGLKKTYGRARKAMEKARSSRTPEDFHDWRKRVKYHWYHARLLAPVAPDSLASHVVLANRLGDRLGDHHDLVPFRQRLAEAPLPEADRSAIAKIVEGESARLEQDAFTLGDRLFDDKPRVLARRWRAWWKNPAD